MVIDRCTKYVVPTCLLYPKFIYLYLRIQFTLVLSKHNNNERRLYTYTTNYKSSYLVQISGTSIIVAYTGFFRLNKVNQKNFISISRYLILGMTARGV